MKEQNDGGRRELSFQKNKAVKEQANALRKVKKTIPAPSKKSKKFEVTEREKYLLEVMARVIAQGYVPDMHRRDRFSNKDIETVLRNQIKSCTETKADR